MLITSRKKLVAIVGPTAVGKTALSIKLAKELKTDIISADSRQFFRELTIGTAKPSPSELAAVFHHFINSHSIHQDYDAAAFAKDAANMLPTLFEKHDVVVLCGGSGLYIKALLDGFDNIPPVAPEIREELVRQYAENGLSWLQDKMRAVDPGYAEKIDLQNPHRIIRALEVKIGTGSSLSSYFSNQKRKHDFEVMKIGLELPRDILYKRIDLRMDDMIKLGLFDEAHELYPLRNQQALQTVGYKEIFDFLEKKFDREEAIRLLKRNSRRYAKRQLTWFKRDEGIKWFDARDEQRILDYIRNELARHD